MAEHDDRNGELVEIGRKGGYTASRPFTFADLPSAIREDDGSSQHSRSVSSGLSEQSPQAHDSREVSRG